MKFFDRLIFKFSCAFKGLKTALIADNSFKTHIVFLILVIIAGFFFHLTPTEWALLIFAIGLVIVAELFNTAIEFLVRMFTQEYHELAEKLLDISAGAVLFSVFTALVMASILIIPRLF